MDKILLSHKISEQKLQSDSPKTVYGSAHYSWKIVADLYVFGFEAAEVTVEYVNRPEIFNNNIALGTLTSELNPYHFSFKPIEHLRKLKGAKNFFGCGWDFSDYSTSDYDVSPYYNQIKILKDADIVICYTEYTAGNLQRLGVKNTFVMPPPINGGQGIAIKTPIAKLDCVPLLSSYKLHQHGLLKLNECIPAGSLVFISVLNPFDRRKCITSMLKGFADAVTSGVDAYLVIKLVIDNEHTRIWNINEILSAHYSLSIDCNRIYFVADYFSDENLNILLSMADFYLCTSSAETLNIPLISSMSLGIPSVSTRGTAMGTYLCDSCSIEIKSREQSFSGAHFLSGYLAVSHWPPFEASISEAVTLASKVDVLARMSMGQASRANYDASFSVSSFIKKLSFLMAPSK
jgi:glycosyltransferase involved in cell wall biosynthesis